MPKTTAKPAAAKLYAVVGSDDVEVKQIAAELAEKLKSVDAGDFGLETIDGAADNADQAATRIRSTIEALRTLPFFGGEKLVWLKNANFLGDDQKARSAAVQAALEELTETINAGLGSEIIFLISAIDVDKRRSFYKSLAKRAELQIFEKLDSSRSGWEEEATEMVQARAIGSLLVAILPTVRNLLLAKDLMERHRLSRPHAPFPFISAINRLPADAIAHLPRKKDGTVNAYALGIAAQNAHRFSTDQLIAGMQACLAANLQLVTTQLDHELILTEVVVKLLGEA